MKQLLLILILITSLNKAQAQTKWNKKNTKAVQREYFDFITKSGIKLKKRQQLDLAKCYPQLIQVTYDNQDAYSKLSDSSKTALMKACTNYSAKTMYGMNIMETATTAVKSPSMEFMSGRWFDGKSDFYLYPDGRVSITLDPDRDPRLGTWTLTNNLLTLKLKVLFKKPSVGEVKTFNIYTFQNNQFYYQDGRKVRMVVRK